MTSINLQDIVFPGAVSLAAALQSTRFARHVGKMRQKFKIEYPSTSGDPAFERAFRAQQNCLEFMPIFMPCLWVSSLFFHPVPASLVGCAYLFGRQKYFYGYCESVKGRLPGFALSVRCLMAFLFMGVCGISTTLLRRYTDLDIAQTFWEIVEKFTPK